MHLRDYVNGITGKPSGQWAILAFDIGIAGAPQPPTCAFTENFDGAAATIRGPWMAASKSEMAQNISVHTEMMLMNRLRANLNAYIAREGRRPYSVGLFSYYSPCRHCVDMLKRSVSHGIPGKVGVSTTSHFGYADGFTTPVPKLGESVGLRFFDCAVWYTDPKKHGAELKSWYATVKAAQAKRDELYASGWQRFVADPLPTL